MIYNFESLLENMPNKDEQTRKTIYEAYYGETKEIKEMQECLTRFRQKYIGKRYFTEKLSIDPDLQQFNRLVEDYWGFYRFALVIVNDGSTNAHTLSMGHRIDYKASKNMNSRKGFKYNKSDGYVTTCNVTSGLMFSEYLTDRHVFSIILHEIGHNFEGTVDKSIDLYYNVTKFLLLPLILASTIFNPVQTMKMFNKSFNWYIDLTEKIKRDYKPIQTILDAWSSLTSIMDSISSDINAIAALLNPIGVLAGTGVVLIQNIKMILLTGGYPIFKMFAYGSKGEIIADTFPSMYGYGADLVEAFDIIKNIGAGSAVREIINKNPIVGNYLWLITFPQIFVMKIFDEHPSDAARYKQQFIYIQRELEKGDIDPKLKKELLDRSKVIEKQIDECLKINKKYYGTAAATAYNKIIYALYMTNNPIGKLHTAKINNIYDKIDDALNK